METKWIRGLFSFSRKERNGIIALLFIILILIAFGKLMPLLFTSEKTDFSKWEAEVDSFFAKTKINSTTDLPVSLSSFDPNDVDSIGLAKMGVPLKVASNWLKYLQKGGRFRNKEDVKKIFGMSTQLFERLDNFMVVKPINILPVKVKDNIIVDRSHESLVLDTFKQRNFVKPVEKPVSLVELNSADSINLLEIKGIGPVFASRIIRFRNLLGGYCSVSQLKEIYGMKPENFETVSPCFTVDQTAIKTFNINFSTVQELGRHPYIGFKTARRILKLRDQKGKFYSTNDLTTVVSSDTLLKLSPYLRFSQ
ncbi:MAG: helix-hairpin-helix domain-containing protein [Mariniphaga sp.]